MNTRRPAPVVVAVVVALLVAAVAGWVASAAPDGLERVAEDQGISDRAEPHALDDGPLAGYAVRGVDDDGVAAGLAGAVGVVATLAVGSGVAAGLHRARRARRVRRPLVEAADGSSRR